MNVTRWRFEALDTWFFRESRPHESVGGVELSSIFPPPARTTLGALRTLWGEIAGVDWRKFADTQDIYAAPAIPELDVLALFGRGNSCGQLHAYGPWVCCGEERLYPAPAFLLEKDSTMYRLSIGAPVTCDLGAVRLPALPDGAVGAKPLENAWLTKVGLEQVLRGEVPNLATVHRAKELFSTESRLGISRDNSTRMVKESLLYQTRHVRPLSDLAVELDVAGLDARLYQRIPQQAQVRFGGEGRVASVSHHQPVDFLAIPQLNAQKSNTQTHGIILILLTPARLPSTSSGNGWLPDGFTKITEDKTTVWKGVIHGVNLTIVAAVLGKTQREGGWDLAAGGAATPGAPRAVESLVPAGSSWYCQVQGDLQEAIKTLHGKQIGNDQALGRGMLAVGLWQDN